jgi:hypothetical protein
MLIPLRMPHHRTADPTGQPVSGLFRQVLSTGDGPGQKADRRTLEFRDCDIA